MVTDRLAWRNCWPFFTRGGHACTAIKISIVIETKYLELAVRALHDEFDLDEEPKKVESELTPSAEQG